MVDPKGALTSFMFAKASVAQSAVQTDIDGYAFVYSSQGHRVAAGVNPYDKCAVLIEQDLLSGAYVFHHFEYFDNTGHVQVHPASSRHEINGIIPAGADVGCTRSEFGGFIIVQTWSESQGSDSQKRLTITSINTKNGDRRNI